MNASESFEFGNEKDAVRDSRPSDCWQMEPVIRSNIPNNCHERVYCNIPSIHLFSSWNNAMISLVSFIL